MLIDDNDDDCQLLEAVSHLGITGMRPGDKLASVKLEAMDTECPQVRLELILVTSARSLIC